MKNILFIGGPKTVQGVDRVDDDLLSIISESDLYNRSSVVVWPTKDFMQPPNDTSKLEPYLDMHVLAMDQMGKQGLMDGLPRVTPAAIYALGDEALGDPAVRSSAVVGEAISEAVFRLSKLVLAVSGGQNLVVVVDEPPNHALCWTRLVDSWKANGGVAESHYDTKSQCYGALNSIKSWPLMFDGLKPGFFTAADLVPMGNVEAMGHVLPVDVDWYSEVMRSLAGGCTVRYPVMDRFGAAKAVEAVTDGGYMLVVPKPDKFRNFIIGLKTGRGKPESVDVRIEARPRTTKAKTDQYMTRKEVADLFKKSERTIDRWRDQGKLESKEIGNSILITKASVEALTTPGSGAIGCPPRNQKENIDE